MEQMLIWMKYDIVITMRVVLALCLGKISNKWGRNMGE
jgi:hypothetical protein